MDAESANIDLFSDGIKVKDMQTDVTLSDGVISGTLHKLTSGSLAEHWGAGYFLALKFTAEDWDDYTSVKVGLNPSYGSGLVEVKTDPDKDGAFKITDPLDQSFVVEYTDGTYTRRDTYSLKGLVFES